jgi:hypothetical protein
VVDHLLDREPGQRPTLGTLEALLEAQLQLGAVADGACGGPTSWWRRCTAALAGGGTVRTLPSSFVPAAPSSRPLLGFVGGPVALVGGPVALVGDPVAYIGGPLASVGEMVAVISGPVPLIGDVVALVSGSLACGQVVLGVIQRRGASGQPGLGRLQRLFGLPSPRLGRPDRASSSTLAATRSRWTSWTSSWATSASLRDDDRARPRSWWNAWSNVIPSVAATIPLACSIQTRLASACRSWATSTWWLANSTAVRTSSGSPPRTPPAPGPRLASRPAAGWHTHSGSDRLVGQPHRHAQRPPHLQLSDHDRDPVPDQLAAQVLDGHHPVLGEGGQAWPLAEVALDLLQQLHRRIGGRHPPRLAVLTGQGEAGAIDPDHRPGYLHHPSQPGQQILGLRMARSSATLRATS